MNFNTFRNLFLSQTLALGLLFPVGIGIGVVGAAGCTKDASSKELSKSGDTSKTPAAAADSVAGKTIPAASGNMPKPAVARAPEMKVMKPATAVAVAAAAKSANSERPGVTAAAVGADSTKKPGAKQATPSTPDTTPKAVAMGNKALEISKKWYSVSIDAPAAATGKEGALTLTLLPKAGRHINQEFPTKLTVVAPSGVTVAKAKLRKADAAHFTEHKATFVVKYTAAAAGAKAFQGKFKFAVCTDTTCDPQSETLAFNVSVK